MGEGGKPDLLNASEAGGALSPASPVARRALPEWRLTVLDTAIISPNFLRLSLSGPDLSALHYVPGQSLRFVVPDPFGVLVQRDYTIRAFDPECQRLEVDVFLHGATPGPLWARALRPGDPVAARGPRSRVRLWPGQDWYVLAGDETAMPAILHMLEHLPVGAKAQAFIEIADPRDGIAPDLPDAAQLTWVTGGPEREADFAAQVLSWPRPQGLGQAVLIGQTAKVQAIRRGLLAQGFAREDIAAEGYWRPGRSGGTVEALD